MPLPETVTGRWPTSVRWAVAAITLHFFVSSSLLFNCGIPYDVPGGNPLTKFHPSTYLVAVAALFAIKERAQGRGVSDAPVETCFVLAMITCSVFSGLSIGTRGAAIFIENFVSAGLLAYVLSSSSASIRGGIGRLLLFCCLANVVVAVGETMTQSHVVPPYLGDTQYIEAPGDFRGTAGYGHPLMGAFVTMMGLLCLPRLAISRLLSIASFGLLSIGLLAFGGRTALAVSILAVIFLAFRGIILGLAQRQISPRLVASVLLGTMLLPPLGYGVLNYTPIGVRITSHLFVDESAETRSVQWRVLDKISLQNELFGVPEDDIPYLIKSVDMDERLGAIENPWLLIFLKLGVIGCLIFACGFVPFLMLLWFRSVVEGRLVLVAGLAVISSFNSVGVKSDVLFFFVAFIMCAPDYAVPFGTRHASASLRPPTPHVSLDTPFTEGHRVPVPALRQL
jgi:hypothetical protein